MRKLLLVCALLSPAVGCYQVDSPVCSYSCGPDGSCPGNYTCNTKDNYCHRNDAMNMACEYSDASIADESVPVDMTRSVNTDALSTDALTDGEIPTPPPSSDM